MVKLTTNQHTTRLIYWAAISLALMFFFFFARLGASSRHRGRKIPFQQQNCFLLSCMSSNVMEYLVARLWSMMF